MSRRLLAIDQGTTSTTALVMDLEGRTLGRATAEVPQHFPRPGWVEHDADEIWNSVVQSVYGALRSAGADWRVIAAIGLTNQRETTLVWDRETGQPIHRAIVWQDRRTADHCAKLESSGIGPRVRQVTGLVLDPYFSGTKLAWVLDHVAGARRRAERGELVFGTIDSYLVWRLSGGQAHVTDVTNASRTLLFDLEHLAWSPEMLTMLEVPDRVLPTIVASAQAVASTVSQDGIAAGIPICGMAGDQQAALVGQGCFGLGDSKCTYGTGAFVLLNTGARRVSSQFGLLTTVGWKIGADVAYALEGSVFVAGAAVQWLRDGLRIIKSATEIEALARQVESADGVMFVPALAGLGAPHWDSDARGTLCGLTRGTGPAHIARATLEAIAFQVDDLVRAMAADLGSPLERMRVDGGAATNNLLLELQADLSNLIVERPAELESTARGAAVLAALGAGLLPDLHAASRMSEAANVFRPTIGFAERERRRISWQLAVRRARLGR